MRREQSFSGHVAIAILVIGLGLGACSDNPAPSAGGTTPPATTSPTVTPSPRALCAHEFTTCQITAGTYSTAPFEHPFTFTITTGWSNNRAWPHGGEIASGNAAFQWGSGVKSGIVGGKSVPIGPTPGDVIAHLRKFDGFTVSTPSPVTIGGVQGQQIDVTTNQTAAQGFFEIPEDKFNLAPGEKDRFYLLDKDGATVILIVGAFKEAEFDAFIATTQPILDSITWQ